MDSLRTWCAPVDGWILPNSEKAADFDQDANIWRDCYVVQSPNKVLEDAFPCGFQMGFG